ncbi:MAG TPA: SDR family oxidoreductase [Cryomorphaceae bacterium]|nr:SDR family oxidoreductase [Cryomorphaceae bacterium]
MKILITGGAGYIGTELCLRIMDNPEVESVTVYDNLARKNHNFFLGPEKLNDKVSFMDADLLDTYSLGKAIRNADCVVHMAAVVTTPFADQSPHLFDQVNNWGTAELCHAFEESDSRRLIYMSSAGVYGAGEGDADLDTKPNPRTFYGISKLKGERHVERLSRKKETAIVRCANVYGYSKSMRFDAVINKFVLQTRHIGRVNIIGTGDQYRAFVEVQRVVDFLERMLLDEHVLPLYNLVDDNFTVNDIAYALKEVTPSLEMIYVDQQANLRQIRVKRDANVQALIGPKQTDIQAELEDFLNRLA